MHPVVYIELVSGVACLVALVFLIRGWKRPDFLHAIPALLLLLAVLMMFYGLALSLEWSGLSDRLQWHFIEDFASVFIPVLWAFVFYAFVKNAVEDDLKASQEYFRDLVESTNDWIWEVDAGGHYTYVSPRVEAILGYTPEEILGKTPFDLMAPGEAEKLSEKYAQFAAAKEPFQDLVNVNLHRHGHRVTLETNGTPILDKDGNLLGYRGVDRDISARLEMERIQKQQQAQIHSIFKASPVGVGLIHNRRLIRGNDRFFEITGYTEDELTGMDPRAFYETDRDYINVGEKYNESLRTGFARIEARFVRKDRTVIDVVIYISPIDRENADAGFVVVLQDITATKAARREAVAEKTRAQTYLNIVDVMILVLDERGHVQLLNKKGYELLERTPEQVEGVDWFASFLPSSYRHLSRNAFERLLRGEERAVAYFESPICTPDGKEKLIAWRNVALRDDAGKIVGVISSGLDITETRAAEEALRESDQRLRVALSAAKMGSWRWQVATDEDVRDAGLNAILGLPAEETTQSKEDFFQYVHPEDRQAARNECERAIRDKGACRIQFRIIRKDGSIRWVLDQGKPFYDYNGQLDYMTGVLVDVTEQVESQMQFTSVIESAPMGILTYKLEADDRLVLTAANQSANTILGVSFSQSVGKTIEEVFPELIKSGLPDEYRRICREGGLYHGTNFEYHDEHVGGYYEFDAFQISPGNMAVAFMDVTQRILTEQQLQFAQYALDHAGQAVYVMDQDENFVYVNEMACEMEGYTRAELLTMKVPAVDPFYPSGAWKTHWDEMRKEGIRCFEAHHKRKDGTVYPIEVTSRFLTYQDKEFICSAIQDITERKSAEEEREELLEKLQFTQFAFDNAGIAAHWVDFDENFIYVNDMDCEELGYTREELMQMKVCDIDPFYPREDWENHWNEMRKTGVRRFEGRHRRKDGTIFPVSMISKFFTYGGKEFICSFERDITERKIAEQERDILMQQIRNRNDELQSIVFTAAHDLRSPLVNISGFTGELEKGLNELAGTLQGLPLDAETAEHIEFLLKTDIEESLRFIKFGNKQMDMLLGGLMRLSRVGSAPVKQITLDMNELLSAVVRGFQYQVKTLDVKVTIDKNLPECIGDYSLLAQVFINLLDNAIKYRNPDHKAVIKIGAAQQDDMIEYSIADNGIGIEAEQLDKVFDLFHQLHKKTDSEGQGLGLTIVRRIMDRQQGDVRIESTPGKGTTVFVALPAV
jgi:PAS domain S-box-containing protein